MKRREFIKTSALLAGAFGINYTPLSALASSSSGNKKNVIYIFLRGGGDVLSLFPPKPDVKLMDAKGLVDFNRHPLFGLRGEAGNINLAKSFIFNAKEGSKAWLAQDAFSVAGYGVNFHPNWAPLRPVIESNNFGLILHTGSMINNKSHFDQMDYIESGSNTRKLNSGFLGRTSNLMRLHSASSQTIAMGALPPRSLTGFDASSLSSLSDVTILNSLHNVKCEKLTSNERLELFKTTIKDASCKAQRFCNSVDGAQANLDELKNELEDLVAPETGFVLSCRIAAHLSKVNSGIMTIDLGGWDHHFNQRPTEVNSILSRKLKELVDGLSVLDKEMSSDTVVVVMSEFGRTVVGNQNFGTDHGRGSAMMLMGKSIRRRVLNSNLQATEKAWDLTNLDGTGAGRSLKVYTDYREVMAEVLQKHLGISLVQNDIKNQNLTIFDGLSSYTNRKIFG